jgi:hypothetical protein
MGDVSPHEWLAKNLSFLPQLDPRGSPFPKFKFGIMNENNCTSAMAKRGDFLPTNKRMSNQLGATK